MTPAVEKLARRIVTPSRDEEREYLRELAHIHGTRALVAGVDEVGRGSLAGPVSVGIAVIDANTPDQFPEGLRDSKQLSPVRRARIVEECRTWPLAVAVGHAEASVVDSLGIIAALRVAASHAIAQLDARGLRPSGVLLDGSYDWWSAESLLCTDVLPLLPVRTIVKGDASCAVIAAASVVAKVERDALMVENAALYPGYDWEHNKGYSSATHVAGLRELGPSPLHRTSWHLPGISE